MEDIKAEQKKEEESGSSLFHLLMTKKTDLEKEEVCKNTA